MFTITITETKTVGALKGNEWLIVEKRPYTPDELKETGDPEYYKKQLKDIRGYSPVVTETVTKDIEILKQTIKDIDLVSVIKAINKIGE